MSGWSLPPVDTVLIDASPGERRLVALRAGQPWRLVLDRPHRPSRVGDVHLGRVRRVDLDLGLAFLDIGIGTDAVMRVPRRHPPTEGAGLVVQVSDDGRPGKAPSVARRVAIAGRLLVLTTERPGVAASRRLADPDEARRLQGIVLRLAARGEGIVIRATAAGADAGAIEAELAALRARRQALVAEGEPRRLLAEPDPIQRWFRDEAPTAPIRVHAAGPEALMAARAAGRAPEPWRGPEPLLEAFGAEAEIEAALGAEVPLPGGGSLAVEPTRALVAIDVDGGPQGAMAANLAAAVEAARQIRFRNLAGLIVIDFVTVTDPPRRREIDMRLRAAFADDPAEIDFVPINELGLAAISRERRGPALPDLPPAETAVLAAFRAASEAQRHAPAALPRIALAPEAAALLEGPLAPALAETARQLGRAPAIAAEAGLAPGRWRVDMMR